MAHVNRNRLFQHENGNKYRVLCVSNHESDRDEYPETVTYYGSNGKLWSKAMPNFLEKMTPIEDDDSVFICKIFFE